MNVFLNPEPQRRGGGAGGGPGRRKPTAQGACRRKSKVSLLRDSYIWQSKAVRALPFCQLAIRFRLRRSLFDKAKKSTECTVQSKT